MKTAFITGASGGIGSAIAEKFKKSGYNAIIGYFSNKENAEKLAEEIGAFAVRIDVTSEESVKKAFQKAREKFGRIDVLINCAGVALPQKVVTDVSGEEFDRVFAVNVKGAFNCVKEALHDMLYLGHGDIVNVSSIWGIDGASCEVVYSASKGALNSFTLALADELALSNIKVNAVAPGFVRTKMNAHLTEEDEKRFLEENGLGSLTSKEQVAEVVFSLVSGIETGRIIRIENLLK